MSSLTKTIVLFIAIIFCIRAFSSDNPDYKVSLIAPELLKNAKAVIRNHEITIDVNNDDASEKHTYAITILNKNGYDLSIFQEFYDAYTSISGIHLRIFDSEGKKIRTFGGDDVKDYSAISGFSLYEDNRVKYIDPQYRNYPFTVEFTYKKKLKSLMFLPYWMIYPDYNCAVEKSSLTVILSKNSKVRYYEKNIPQTCKIEEKDGIKTLSWSVINLPAFSEEDFEESLIDYSPIIFLSPEEFEVNGIKGDLRSWQSFGKWRYELHKNKDVLPQETIKRIQELTNGMTTRQKVQKIYEYVQQRTRYVNITVGIGGWQPIDAAMVDRVGYGDCKALSNYTYSLLKAAGVSSYCSLINAGEDGIPIIANFPFQFFNHEILIVPIDNDTLFLECTSPYKPYGHIGSFTDNRLALILGETGGTLIRTRIYKPEENIISSKCFVKLDEEGSGFTNTVTSYSGVHFDGIKELSVQSNDKIKKVLYSQVNISNYVITSFSFDQPDKTKPFIIEKLDLSLDKYATILNKKMIISLNLRNKISEIPNITDQRKSDIVIRRPSIEIDTVEFKIPSGYNIDKVPQEVNLSSEFGDYQAKCIASGYQALYIRKFELKSGRYKLSEANNIKEFYGKVCQADLMKLTLLRK